MVDVTASQRPDVAAPTSWMQVHHMVPKIVAACSGSLLTSVVVNPFDVVRVRMQKDSAYTPHSNGGPLASIPVSSLRPPPGKVVVPTNLGAGVCCKDVFWYPSGFDYCVASELTDPCINEAAKPRPAPQTTWKTLTGIANEEGPRALWRGLSVQLVQSIPANVVYFVSYEYLRDNSPIQHWPNLNPFLCGGFARMLASTVISPIELFKTRLQSAKGPDSFAKVTRSVQELVRSKGTLSLWSGLTLTLWRDVPFSSIYWFIIEYCRSQFKSYRASYEHELTARQKTINRFSDSVISGTVGGLIASVITTPFDVGKTRKQLTHHTSPGAKMHMLPFMVQVVREEGFRALFVGVVPRMLKVAPACAIMITSYEMGKYAFGEDVTA